MLKFIGALSLALAISWGVALPLEMLALGGIHHYWSAIPALGYGALFFISLLISIAAFFYGVNKGILQSVEDE